LILILVIVALLAMIGNFIIKPRHDKVTLNPYDLKIDSIGQIAKKNYGDFISEKITVPLKTVLAITVDKGGHIYLSGDSGILIISRQGEEIIRFNTETTATALSLDDNDRIIAAFENHVAVYSSKGKLLSKWAVIRKETYITSVAVSNKSVFLADASLGLVYEFTPEGSIVRTIGSKDKTDEVSCFILPSYYFDVAIAPDSTLWVANTGRHKLVNFYRDGRLRSFWGNASSSVEDFCGCCNPSHFAIMNDGSFITAEKGIVRVKKYNATGIFVCAIAGPEQFKPGSSGLDIATNAEDEILVLEPSARMIHIFKEKKQSDL